MDLEHVSNRRIVTTMHLLLACCVVACSLAAIGAQRASAQQAAGADASQGLDAVAAGLEPVRVSQVGYLPAWSKVAIVVIDDASRPFETFLVRDVRTGEVVFAGTLAAPMADASSGDVVQQADFSALRAPGRYRVDVPGLGRSLWFDVGERVFHAALFATGRSYTLQRSATSIRDPVTGLALNAGHLQDREARLFFNDAFHDEGDVLDVLGGWYDAGDFGMYIPPSNVTVAQLLLAYEWYPDAFYAGQFAFPVGVERVMDGAPDLLEEVRFNLAWMLAMQRPDGAVYHKKSGLRWPSDSTLPVRDTQQRYVFGLSTFGTAGFAGATAMAARVFADVDPAFAAELLDAAERAFAYLEANPEPAFRFDQGQDQGSGPYRKDSDAEERLWAAAELLRTTGDERFEAYIAGNQALDALLDAPSQAIGWLDASLLGQWAYVHAPAADPERQERARRAILAGAEAIAERVRADGYSVALPTDEYYWASAKTAVANGNVLLMAHALEPNVAFVDAALDQVAYVFGRNATSYSYVTGLGHRSPASIHHRIATATGIVPPGLVVGGPNAHGGDPLLDALLETDPPPPAKAYLDLQGSWATNEYAIDYTAPLLFALASFAFGAHEPGDAPDAAVLVDLAPLEPGTIDAFPAPERLGTFTDGASHVSYEIDDGVLAMSYGLREAGWLGLVMLVDRHVHDVAGLRVEVRGQASGHEVRFEIKDAQGVHFEWLFVDDSVEWRTLEVDLDAFDVREDWQPDGVHPEPGHVFDRARIEMITFSPLTTGQGRIEFRAVEAY